MAIISFINPNNNQIIADNVYVKFYLSDDTNLNFLIGSGYTSHGSINVASLNAGYSYQVLFSGQNAPTGIFYVTIPYGTDSAVLTLTQPSSSFSDNPSNIAGPQGEQGASGLFQQPYLLTAFNTAYFVNNANQLQLISLTDNTAFPPGSFIELYNNSLRKSGIWQVVQQSGIYFTDNNTMYNLLPGQLLIYPIDNTNAPKGWGYTSGDIFTSINTFATFGATNASSNIANLDGIELTNPQNNDILVYKNGNFVNLSYLIYETDFFLNTIPLNQVVYRTVFAKNVNINGAVAIGKNFSTQTATFMINKNNFNIGNISFYPNGSTSCSISGSNSVNFTYGDYLEVISPASQDLTLANIAIKIIGYLV